MDPSPRFTASEKFKVILLSISTFLKLFPSNDGEKEDIVGAVVSILIGNAEEDNDVLPALSVAVAVMEKLPPDRVDEVMEKAPSLSAVALPKFVLMLSPIKLWLEHW